MGITIRYFSVSSSGLGDGTSISNVASLFTSSGTWSDIIRNFPFASGSDSLDCRILQGAYSCKQTLSSSILRSGAPTFNNQLFLTAANSDGSVWQPPDPDWSAAEPVWNTGTMPFIEYSGTSLFTNLSNSNLYGLNLDTNSGSSLFSGLVSSINQAIWCYFTAKSTTGSFNLFGSTFASNVVCKANFLTYDNLFGSLVSRYYNCRAEGNLSSTTGSRYGFNQSGANAPIFIKCVSINNRSHGFAQTNTFNSSRMHLYNCISYGNSGDGYRYDTASATSHNSVENSIFIKNYGNGLKATSSGVMFIFNSYFRDNVSGNFSGIFSNIPSGDYSIFSGGSDLVDFVNPTGLDFRIKYGSPLWGKGIGAGDEPAPSSVSSVANILHPLAYTGKR